MTTNRLPDTARAVIKALVIKADDGKTPYLELLVSGTKLDVSTTPYEINGQIVILQGDRITPQLLASMAEQAKAGKVTLLENHHASLPMGVSCDSRIETLPDGNQNLYVMFICDPEDANVQTLQRRMDQGYKPSCSVGLEVDQQAAYDATKQAWTGKLTQGEFEHVALTRPDHNAYPDAAVEGISTSPEFKAAAVVAVNRSTFYSVGSSAHATIHKSLQTRINAEEPPPVDDKEKGTMKTRNKEAEGGIDHEAARKEAMDMAEQKRKDAEAEASKLDAEAAGHAAEAHREATAPAAGPGDGSPPPAEHPAAAPPAPAGAVPPHEHPVVAAGKEGPALEGKEGPALTKEAAEMEAAKKKEAEDEMARKAKEEESAKAAAPVPAVPPAAPPPSEPAKAPMRPIGDIHKDFGLVKDLMTTCKDADPAQVQDLIEDILEDMEELEEDLGQHASAAATVSPMPKDAAIPATPSTPGPGTASPPPIVKEARAPLAERHKDRKIERLERQLKDLSESSNSRLAEVTKALEANTKLLVHLDKQIEEPDAQRRDNGAALPPDLPTDPNELVQMLKSRAKELGLTPGELERMTKNLAVATVIEQLRATGVRLPR